MQPKAGRWQPISLEAGEFLRIFSILQLGKATGKLFIFDIAWETKGHFETIQKNKYSTQMHSGTSFL